MKIALIGYGKMGKAIEGVAIERGHEIVLRLRSDSDWSDEALKEADVAIEFTRPDAAVSNFERCFRAGVACVTGTTAWNADLDHVLALQKTYNATFLYASNFSIGVQIFRTINRRLAELMNTQTNYDVAMTEIHHTQKLDAPSGTAVTLANDILEVLERKERWQLVDKVGKVGKVDIPITAERIDPAPGTHSVLYSSAIDDIEITHTAHSRLGFAMGAVVAAEFLHQQESGVFTMADVLQL